MKKPFGKVSTPDCGEHLSYRELYPEQFAPLAGEEENVPDRKHAVKLEDIGARGENNGSFGKRSTSFDKGSSSFDKGSSSFDEGKGSFEKEKSSFGNDRAKGVTVGAERAETSKDAVKPREKQKNSAVSYAMGVVSRTTVNERMLRDKLTSRGYSEDEVDGAMDYVKRFGYVDDARLAQDTAEKLSERCWGRYKICRYLLSRGFDPDTVDGVDMSEIDFPYYCAKLVRKYPTERRDAMLRAVKNAGYTSSDLRRARELIGEEEE